MITPDRLHSRFEQIYRQRMNDLPIINPKLQVATVAFRPFQQHVLGILLTPWCMNLVLLPAGEDDWPEAGAGATLCVDLPAGTFEFIVAEDEVLGRFLMCSLFSPVLEFTAQSAALDVAEQAMTLLFVTDAAAAVDAAEHGKPCSRRQFLRVRRDVNEHA